MIISHRHRFVFVAIPKTGTHSVREALREDLGPEDIEQVGLFVNRRFPYPELANLGHGHLSLAQVRPYLGEDLFDSYFKFAFVRNPFDRFVSYCAFVTRDDGAFDREPATVMRRILFDARPMDHLLFHPQHVFVCGADGSLLADHVGRVEQMQASYDRIAMRAGLPPRILSRVNATRRADYRTYYDSELVQGVAALYARDIELFGYGF